MSIVLIPCPHDYYKNVPPPFNRNPRHKIEFTFTYQQFERLIINLDDNYKQIITPYRPCNPTIESKPLNPFCDKCNEFEFVNYFESLGYSKECCSHILHCVRRDLRKKLEEFDYPKDKHEFCYDAKVTNFLEHNLYCSREELEEDEVVAAYLELDMDEEAVATAVDELLERTAVCELFGQWDDDDV